MKNKQQRETNNKRQIIIRKIKKDKLAKLEQRLVNKKIKVAKIEGKQTIYQVIECVSLNVEFSTFQSKRVDKDTARQK